MKIKDLVSIYKERLLILYDKNEVNALTLLAISYITGLSNAQVKAFPDRNMTPVQSEALQRILTRLETGEPIQYVLGHTEFYGLPFKVNPSVLIPRPETEELVDWALNEVKGKKTNIQLLDIGTGSGCIAVSLKKFARAGVFAVDISAGALNTARENAQLNEVEIDFIEDDILNPTYNLQHTAYNIIVSNPPYVTMQDKTRMHANVTDFEPHTALFVPENDPLVFYKAIVDFAAANLAPGGLLFLEINESFGQQTIQLLNDKHIFTSALRTDMSGKDRMIKATLV